MKVEAIEEAEKPVSISFEGKSGSKSKVPWVLSFMPETVTVSGASSLIDKVSEVRGTVSVADMSEDHSSWEYATVTAVDEKGNAVAWSIGPGRQRDSGSEDPYCQDRDP